VSEPYEQTVPTADGGVVVPPRALDADGNGQPDYAPDGYAGADLPVTTQAAHPWRASLRTALFSWLPLLAFALGVVPEVVEVILAEVARAHVELPGWLYAALAGAATITALLAAILNRVALLPSWSELLTRLGVGPAPRQP